MEIYLHFNHIFTTRFVTKLNEVKRKVKNIFVFLNNLTQAIKCVEEFGSFSKGFLDKPD